MKKNERNQFFDKRSGPIRDQIIIRYDTVTRTYVHLPQGPQLQLISFYIIVVMFAIYCVCLNSNYCYPLARIVIIIIIIINSSGCSSSANHFIRFFSSSNPVNSTITHSPTLEFSPSPLQLHDFYICILLNYPFLLTYPSYPTSNSNPAQVAILLLSYSPLLPSRLCHLTGYLLIYHIVFWSFLYAVECQIVF